MAPLRNPKHEAFVHNYLKCGDATEAFELTGYTRDSANAHSSAPKCKRDSASFKTK
jgi:phage terminase small subunit